MFNQKFKTKVVHRQAISLISLIYPINNNYLYGKFILLRQQKYMCI